MKKLRTLTNVFLVLIMAGTLLLSSCKKDDEDNGPKLSQEQIDDCVAGAKTISTQMQTFVLSSFSNAIEAGYDGADVPDIGGGKKSGTIINQSAYGDNSWTGPDNKGWYTRSNDIYGINYSEKFRISSDTVIYIYTILYSSGSNSSKTETTTKYFKYTKNNKVVYSGYSLFDYDVTENNDVSHGQWKIVYKDWNPLTNSGTYDWYIGLLENSDGDIFPLFRYLNVIATESATNKLHVKTTWYDEHSIKVWEWEYDTPYEPVDIDL